MSFFVEHICDLAKGLARLGHHVQTSHPPFGPQSKSLAVVLVLEYHLILLPQEDKVVVGRIRGRFNWSHDVSKSIMIRDKGHAVAEQLRVGAVLATGQIS
jgi:hypothetical protein